jgi:ribosomal protein S18 acetylase RimI-like enzyme
MAATVRLRRARPEDAPAIAAVHVETWRQAYSDVLPAAFLDALDVGRRRELWDAQLRATPADRRPWVAEIDDRVVGFVSSGPSRDADARDAVGEVYAIYVVPDCWGTGIGRDLLRRAERDLRDHGYPRATLWVLADNQRARRFYEAAGWTPADTRTETIGGKEVEEVRYRRTIEPA